jgi:hypothetical protein
MLMKKLTKKWRENVVLIVFRYLLYSAKAGCPDSSPFSVNVYFGLF